MYIALRLWLGMDSDVWKFELFVSYPLKTLIWISVFTFLIWMSDGCIRIQFSILSELFDKNPTYPTLFVSAKIKYP
jgi:hypothetical protein